MEITPDGILILADANGKNIGDGYVQFTSQEHAEQALLKHKETIDKRYIEGFGSVILKNLFSSKKDYSLYKNFLFCH